MLDSYNNLNVIETINIYSQVHLKLLHYIINACFLTLFTFYIDLLSNMSRRLC